MIVMDVLNAYHQKVKEEIRIFLEENKIYYIPQYRFDDCRSIKFNNKLPFDFYLPELIYVLNIMEYNIMNILNIFIIKHLKYLNTERQLTK